MYCPKCGQQQVSDNTRFCSRCGLPLSGLTEWLAGDGVLVRREEAQASTPSPRRKGIKRGVKLMFLACAMVPVIIGFCVLIEHGIPLVIPFTIFLAGLLMTLYARIFGEEIPSVKSQPTRTSGLGTTFGGGSLPPSTNMRMNSVGEERMRTAEIVRPPSVTEHTTRLLNRD